MNCDRMNCDRMDRMVNRMKYLGRVRVPEPSSCVHPVHPVAVHPVTAVASSWARNVRRRRAPALSPPPVERLPDALVEGGRRAAGRLARPRGAAAELLELRRRELAPPLRELGEAALAMLALGVLEDEPAALEFGRQRVAPLLAARLPLHLVDQPSRPARVGELDHVHLGPRACVPLLDEPPEPLRHHAGGQPERVELVVAERLPPRWDRRQPPLLVRRLERQPPPLQAVAEVHLRLQARPPLRAPAPVRHRAGGVGRVLPPVDAPPLGPGGLHVPHVPHVVVRIAKRAVRHGDTPLTSDCPAPAPGTLRRYQLLLSAASSASDSSRQFAGKRQTRRKMSCAWKQRHVAPRAPGMRSPTCSTTVHRRPSSGSVNSMGSCAVAASGGCAWCGTSCCRLARPLARRAGASRNECEKSRISMMIVPRPTAVEATATATGVTGITQVQHQCRGKGKSWRIMCL